MGGFIRTGFLGLAFLLVMALGLSARAESGLSGKALSDTLKVGLTSTPAAVQGGDTLIIEFSVLEAGPEFNAFDAYIQFDPEVLTYLPPRFLREQEGPLMLEACPQTFHMFYQSPDGMTLEVHESLLCAGVSVTGPGVVYRLKFICADVDAYTHLDLLGTPEMPSRFFMNGTVVDLDIYSPLFVQIGDGASGAPMPRSDIMPLHAHPNPLNPQTEFSFSLLEAGCVELDVYDVKGRRMVTLVREFLTSGQQSIVWPGRDGACREVSSGTYLARLRSGGWVGFLKVTVVR